MCQMKTSLGKVYFLYLIDRGKARIQEWIWAYVLIIFGILVREDMFKGVTLVFVSSFIIVFCKEFKSGFENLLKKERRFCLTKSK